MKFPKCLDRWDRTLTSGEPNLHKQSGKWKVASGFFTNKKLYRLAKIHCQKLNAQEAQNDKNVQF